MVGTLGNAEMFLIQTFFDLFIFILMLRFLMQWTGVDYFNPISQITVKLTNPIVLPLKKILPRLRDFDLATVIALFSLEMLKLMLLAWVKIDRIPHISGLLVWSSGNIFGHLINIFFYAILVSIVFSWLNPPANSPIIGVVSRLTEPLMKPARRFIPQVSGFDLTPIPVMIGLKLMTIVLVQPILQVGIAMALAK